MYFYFEISVVWDELLIWDISGLKWTFTLRYQKSEINFYFEIPVVWDEITLRYPWSEMNFYF